MTNLRLVESTSPTVVCFKCKNTGQCQGEGTMYPRKGLIMKRPYYYCCDCLEGQKLKASVITNFKDMEKENGTS